MQTIPKTKREYFYELVRRSSSGLFPSMNHDERLKGEICCYRNGDKACAAGILIPDDKYDKAFETIVLNDYQEQTPMDYRNQNGKKLCNIIKANLPTGMTFHDVQSCQNVHDGYAREVIRYKWEWDHEIFVKKLLTLDCFKEYAND